MYIYADNIMNSPGIADYADFLAGALRAGVL